MFKVGDKVRVTGIENEYGFEVGEELTIEFVSTNESSYKGGGFAGFDNNKRAIWFQNIELVREVVEPTIDLFEGEIFGVAHHLLDLPEANNRTVVLMVANLLGYTEEWVAGRLNIKEEELNG